MKGHLHKKSFRTNNFGKFSVTVSTIELWNKMQGQMGELALKDFRPSKIKSSLADKFIKSYLFCIEFCSFYIIFDWVYIVIFV